MKTTVGLLAGAVLLAGACGGGSSGPATGTVQGLVRDTAGAPLEQVPVQLKNAGTATVVRSATTTSSGAYTMLGIASGFYDVFVTVPSATQVVGVNPVVGVNVTGGGTATADFSLRYLPVSFSTHVEPLLNASCSSGCHGGASPLQGMNLATGQAYTNTVNVPAMEPTPAMDRIEPSDTALSYLIRKIEGTQGSLTCVPAVPNCGQRMPLGAPPLPLQTIRMIKRWVLAGAPNN